MSGRRACIDHSDGVAIQIADEQAARESERWRVEEVPVCSNARLDSSMSNSLRNGSTPV